MAELAHININILKHNPEYYHSNEWDQIIGDGRQLKATPCMSNFHSSLSSPLTTLLC
jgi:hypothetical protein